MDQKLVRSFFDRVAPYYESLYFPLLYRVGTLPNFHSPEFGAEKIVDRLPKESDRALDLACGTGRLTRRLAKKFSFVHGVDRSAGMLEYAQRSVSGSGNGGITYSRSDVMNLPFSPESFDITTCAGAIYFFPELGKFLKKVYTILRKDGIFGGMTLVTRGILNTGLSQFILELARLLETYKVYEVDQFKTALSDAGFTDVDYEIHGCVMVFSCRKGV